MALYGFNESEYFVEVALRINLVIGEYWDEIVAGVELFDGFIMGMDFLDRDAKDAGRFGLESQLFHL